MGNDGELGTTGDDLGPVASLCLDAVNVSCGRQHAGCREERRGGELALTVSTPPVLPFPGGWWCQPSLGVGVLWRRLQTRLQCTSRKNWAAGRVLSARTSGCESLEESWLP